MSTGAIDATGDQLPETVYVCTKKLGVNPREQIVVTSEQAAYDWLGTKIEADDAMGGFEWNQYKKVVAEGDDVYGHIQQVETL